MRITQAFLPQLPNHFVASAGVLLPYQFIVLSGHLHKTTARSLFQRVDCLTLHDFIDGRTLINVCHFFSIYKVFRYN